MKMRRAILITFGLVIFITTVIPRASTSSLNPPDEVDESELEEVNRPIRASAGNLGNGQRKRGRARSRKNGSGEGVSKRRLPTRAPLFEASPADPFLENGEVGPENYGHSHSPPTADPYYSPSNYERERKRKKIKLAGERGLTQNSFDQIGNVNPTVEYQKPGKNYAFAYAVGEDAGDFSHNHKQSKTGPVTVGEYRLTLPDGRTQVVRYTSGDKRGYKADVLYEPADHHAPSSLPVTGGHHQNHHQNGQYLQSVQPTHHLPATPSPSFQNTRVYKSRPLKNVALHSHEDIEYSPGAGDDGADFHPTPKIRSKGQGSRSPPRPTPTTAEYLNGILSNPTTPRPNSIYDKISPYRGGAVKYSGSDELAHAHEQSPRAGPVRSKKHQHFPKVTSTAASFYASPSPSPVSTLKTNIVPTKKYKEPAGVYYSTGHQPQANHLSEYIRPQKHVQYLQETPVHSHHLHHEPQHHHQHHHHHTPLVSKPLKTAAQHVLPLDDQPHHHFKAGPIQQVSYSPLIALPKKKPKKNKHSTFINHGIYQPQGQYLLQSQVTAQTPDISSPYPTAPTAGSIVSTGIPQLPFHYYNSLHHGHHTQIVPSPTPVTTVTHHDTPFPLTFPTGASHLGHSPHQVQTQTSGTGLGYLESPPSGDRPNRLGVKEVLSRLPSHDLATPKTTVHPYEVGSADYGKSVAYGLSKPLDSKGFPEAHYNGGFPTGSDGLLDHLDPTNSIFSSPGTQQSNVGYFPNDVDEHFNFLEGLGGEFDVEQANVREIRQNRPNSSGRGRLRRQRRPSKRQGLPASSDEEDKKTIKPSPTPSRPRNNRSSTTSPRPRPTQESTERTTQRSRGRRRKTNAPQPDPIIRRNRSRGRKNSSK